MTARGNAIHGRSFAPTQYARNLELSDQAKSNIVLIFLTAGACFLATGFGLLLWVLSAIREGSFIP